ncbi:NAD(P)-dependent oxidoreductase [Nguyenibacter vanlangensis]|uniref:NAD(P)-dependent oxidoreductase n=1 Tax=Nguyenibacter vanlangensis TaxID=1216886 RepID=A0ABZ3DA53_9PROT
MKIFVTGGTGSIGLAVAEALLAQGHMPVLFATTAVPPRFGERAPFRGMGFIQGDIGSAYDLDRALGASRPDIVIHLAAVTPDPDAERAAPARVTEINISGVASLMAAARAVPGLQRVVIASSVAVYGPVDPAEGEIPESRPLAPSTLYGISKAAAERTALRLGEIYGLDVRVARIGPVYGPWEHGTAVRPMLSPHAQLLALLLRGKPAVLDRPMAGDWLYSRDAGAGIAALALAPGLTHDIYNIGSGDTSTVVEWGRAMATALRGASVVLAGPGEDSNIRSALQRDRAPLSIDRLVRDTGHEPRFAGTAAVADFLGWLEQYPDDM